MKDLASAALSPGKYLSTFGLWVVGKRPREYKYKAEKVRERGEKDESPSMRAAQSRSWATENTGTAPRHAK
jgi:hypothetical protein